MSVKEAVKETPEQKRRREERIANANLWSFWDKRTEEEKAKDPLNNMLKKKSDIGFLDALRNLF